MFRAFADVQTAEMLNLPRPRLAGAKPPSSPARCRRSNALQTELIARYDRLRWQRRSPSGQRARHHHGRPQARLDARLFSGTATDFPGSKIALVEKVTEIWRPAAHARHAAHLLGYGRAPDRVGYSVYDEIIDKLVKHGIRARADRRDRRCRHRRQETSPVREGPRRRRPGAARQHPEDGHRHQCRNASALHHLDAPWKPAEVEQRDGRILRQGNTNEEVSIFRYVTEGSFDAYMWQALETKARFINQVMTGDSAVRQAEDIGGQELSTPR